ncbi:MAG: tetratricopeptide repeat protein [Gemmatimonadetes bacterium]|nr:tetratricopeptide repeat protein [Gemmatimonadota bacterium]
MARRAVACTARLLLLPLAAAAATSACATKKDVKTLRESVLGLQARQDSVFLELRRQNRELQDSLHSTSELMQRVRGDLGHRLLQIEQQLLQIQELTGQSHSRLQELRRQLETRSQELGPTPAATAAVAPAPARGSPEQLYAIGVEQLQRGAAQTARRAFEEILQKYGTHERAPDAQFNLAETYYLDGQHDRALREFERVVELFPNSARAPAALYRAGVVAEEQGNIARATEYFQRVVSNYARSDEARSAQEKLSKLRRRG